VREGGGATAGLVAAAIGGALVIATSLAGSGFSPLALPFMAWALAPYVLLGLAARMTANRWAVGGAGAAALAAEAGIRAAVFLFPQGSTAAIALVFSPAIIAAIVMPGGALAGAAMGWAFARGNLLVRIPLTVLAAAILGLLFIGLARPELFPTAVASRRAALAAIGDPRVAAGGDRFTRTAVSDRSAWHLAGNYDGVPGDEIAVIDHGGIDLLGPDDFSLRSRIAFGGERGRLWNWYSRLVPIGGTLAVAQTGGGYQETELRSLHNELLWRYRPDASLPPTALLPADLDGDGESEFYASTSSHVVRLDTRGRAVWTKTESLPDLVAVAPPTSAHPGWVVGTQYGRAVRIWDHAGAEIATLPWPGVPPLGVIDWQGKRRLLLPGAGVRTFGLDGEATLGVELGELMTLQQAEALEWRAGDAALAIVAAARADVKRWRLLIVNAAHEVIYDEILDRSKRLIVARDANGAPTLLVSGDGLTALRPVDR